MKKEEFTYCFSITKMIIFEVSYYTLGSNEHPYFTTSACKFNQPKTDWSEGGQAQDRLLTGKAKEFWEKWDYLHLKDLTDIQYMEIRQDIDNLVDTYRYIYRTAEDHVKTFSFYDIKELSMWDK